MSVLNLDCAHGFAMGEGCPICKPEVREDLPEVSQTHGNYWTAVFQEAVRLSKKFPDWTGDATYQVARLRVDSKLAQANPQPLLRGL